MLPIPVDNIAINVSPADDATGVAVVDGDLFAEKLVLDVEGTRATGVSCAAGPCEVRQSVLRVRAASDVGVAVGFSVTGDTEAVLGNSLVDVAGASGAPAFGVQLDGAAWLRGYYNYVGAFDAEGAGGGWGFALTEGAPRPHVLVGNAVVARDTAVGAVGLRGSVDLYDNALISRAGDLAVDDGGVVGAVELASRGLGGGAGEGNAELACGFAAPDFETLPAGSLCVDRGRDPNVLLMLDPITTVDRVGDERGRLWDLGPHELSPD